jgi:hypothetical protein
MQVHSGLLEDMIWQQSVHSIDSIEKWGVDIRVQCGYLICCYVGSESGSQLQKLLESYAENKVSNKPECGLL